MPKARAPQNPRLTNHQPKLAQDPLDTTVALTQSNPPRLGVCRLSTPVQLTCTEICAVLS